MSCDPVVLQKLQRYCIGETNELCERYRFNKKDQEPNESLDASVTALRTLAKTCSFGVLENSLIRDRIVIGVRDSQRRKKLLQVSKLTLKECISVDHMRPPANNWKKLIRRKSAPLASPLKRNLCPPRGEKEIRCKFYAKTHVWNKLKCPAWGKNFL